MKHRFVGLLMIGLFGLPLVSPSSAKGGESDVANWDFDVYLNDKKVGKHSFTVSETDGMKRVQSQANFNVKVLFITAYQYEHSAAERWAGNCLVEFDASTNANGERIRVSGQKTSTGFLIESGESPVKLPECVMTFAYWNPEFLEQPKLLNPQTGEFVDIRVEEVGNELL